MGLTLSSDQGREALRNLIEDVSEGETLSFDIEGTSMEPLLRQGDTVTVRRIPLGTLRLGELAVFFRTPDPASGCVAHRLIWRSARQGEIRYYPKGDHERSAEYFTADRFIGRVDHAEREGRPVRITGARWYHVLKGCLTHWIARRTSRT